MVLTQTLINCPQREMSIPVQIDRRTPASTFDSFTRAVLKGQQEVLWETLHPVLRRKLRIQAQQEGDQSLFRRLEHLLTNEHGLLRLGEPSPAGDMVLCPLTRSGHRVGTAMFRFENLNWYLYSLA